MAQPDWAKEHVQSYRKSGGADGSVWGGFDGTGNFPCLLLTTTGRKSQLLRTTPLIYGHDGAGYIVIASQGGRPAHPGWYLNLQENPQVELQVGADIFAATAATADGASRARLWNVMTAIYPPYDEYREKAAATREIPVVVLRRD